MYSKVFQDDRRPQQQQIADLLTEIADEIEIDTHGGNHRLDSSRSPHYLSDESSRIHTNG